MKLPLRDRVVDRPGPWVMGIVNVTPDSFSDGGRFLSSREAMLQAHRLFEDGADVIDVGGESTRPGSQKISAAEEIDRVLPVISRIKKELNVLVSVDTTKEEVARLAVTEAGADIINDISALAFSPGMAEMAGKLRVPVILMHIKGTPENMQLDPRYDDVIAEIRSHFSERIAWAIGHGIDRDRILLDPGIGFGKRVSDNVQIVRCLGQFRSLGLPLVVGLSRKSFLGKITGEAIPERREAETMAANLVAILNGASVVRVHDVRPVVTAIKVLRELSDIPST